MIPPGIEPGSKPRQGFVLPLYYGINNYSRSFYFISLLIKNPRT